MRRELLLLRHGKAVDFDPRGDFHRALRNRGKRHAQRIAVWLSGNGLVPDQVLSSSAERALNTARKCCKAMGFPAHHIEASEALYQASPQDLLQQLQALPPTANRVMLVGHNPGLEQLLRDLCDTSPGTPADHRLLPTGTLARLAFDGDWHALGPRRARLLTVQRGADLPSSFPFHTPDGVEQRERPDYYYRQSSVIPYRMQPNGLEILMVRSSSNRHWVVPKGIADPGMTAQDSALNEALEEAGVQGRIVGEPLGRYEYPKWGASCSVQVYAMQVTRELPESEWQERHRGRRWVTPEMALLLLRQASALAPMIERLAARHDPCPA